MLPINVALSTFQEKVLEQSVIPFDLARIVFGDATPLYYAEIAVRTVVVYSYTLLVLRWIGGRSVAQMSLIEFLLVIALGSAVGDAMFYPDVPLFHALFVITLVVSFNKVLDALIFRSRTAEKLMEGTSAELVLDGVIRIDAMERLKIGQNELFQSMRREGIRNLGEVERAYWETSGHISFFCNPTPRYGLPVVPPLDIGKPETDERDARLREWRAVACKTCGYVSKKTESGAEACPNCGKYSWTIAELTGR